MRNTHSTTWNMAKKMMNMEKEIFKMYDLEYGKKY
jgi:hypothetical protein